MTTYRIVKKNGRYLLQQKALLFWTAVKYPGGQDYESSDVEYLKKHVAYLRERDEEEKENGKVIEIIE